jgi:septal ring factor EnvC (AmiA/AmiB activator)
MMGSNLVDEVMIPVRAAILRHVKNKDAVTDIYNRCYEAVMASIATIEKMKKHDELRQQITELEADIKRLQSELKAANDDADRLASELEETYAQNDICWEEPGESSPALIAHKLREEKAHKQNV